MHLLMTRKLQRARFGTVTQVCDRDVSAALNILHVVLWQYAPLGALLT